LQFNKVYTRNTTTNKPLKNKQTDILRIPLPISSRPSKSMLAKSKIFNKNQPSNSSSNFNNQSYVQVSKSNIKEIIKIKDTFPKLSFDKITEIYNIINNTSQKSKLKFNMMILQENKSSYPWVWTTLKELFFKQIITLLTFKISTDYIWSDNRGIILTTNKVAVFSDLNIVEKYMKELNNVNSNDLMNCK